MKVSVLGCGRWGSFLAWYCHNILNFEVTIWGRESSESFKELAEKRKNPYLSIADNIKVTSDLDDALASSLIIVSISAQQLRNFASQLSYVNPDLIDGKDIVLCMKGLESSTGKRLTQVFREELKRSYNLAVLLGPGHVQDLVMKKPTCMLIGSDDINTTLRLVEMLTSDLIRLYMGQDLIGNEIGAAAKNVFGIAAGMLDALDLSTLKGVLMARGAREIARLVRAMGGNELTAYGLSHLGDFQATLFSEHSHNRRYGMNIVAKENTFHYLAEGAETAKALVVLADLLKVDLPICDAVNKMITQDLNPKEELDKLFKRDNKFEF